ncbi:bacteriophage Mu Gam like family protein [Escherichia coli DEC6C]|nr:bacteriophage Mu Gam like family protein [Escherichia coli DEC6C]
MSWRLEKPSCSVSRDVEGVIEMLRRMGLERFIRTKEEVNKQAILAEPDAVKGIAGIKVNKGAESFSVEPFEQDAGLNK